MHELLAAQPGSKKLLLGNEAIVRGALEAGISFATTYPGTPSSEIGDNFYRISQETNMYFEYSVNEKVALETAAAASTSGLRTMCSMKHVGLNVASDALMTLAYVGVTGGMVIVSADDPSMHSSQNEQDNRFYARFAGIPMLEPADSQEALDMARAAFDLSEYYGIPVLLRTTTRINHSRSVVKIGALHQSRVKGRFVKDPLNLVPVPMVARRLHVELLQKLEKLRVEAESSSFNRVEGQGPWGVVTSGVSYNYVKDAIRELNIADQVQVLKLIHCQRHSAWTSLENFRKFWWWKSWSHSWKTCSKWQLRSKGSQSKLWVRVMNCCPVTSNSTQSWSSQPWPGFSSWITILLRLKWDRIFPSDRPIFARVARTELAIMQ